MTLPLTRKLLSTKVKIGVPFSLSLSLSKGFNFMVDSVAATNECYASLCHERKPWGFQFLDLM